MYERMLAKNSMPSESEIEEYIGVQSFYLLHQFEEELSKRYDLNKLTVFPFGNNYGWSYKYSCKSKHLCHLFFEKDAFTILLQISGKDVEKIENILIDCLAKSKEIWEHRYLCGDGGWMHYRIMNLEEMNDMIRFIEIKKKPIKS